MVLVQTRFLFWVWDKKFKWDTTLVFDLGFGLGLNLSFILGFNLSCLDIDLRTDFFSSSSRFLFHDKILEDRGMLGSGM